MTQITKPDKRDIIRSIFYLTLYVIVIACTAFVLLPDLWVIWFALVLAGMLMLVNWHKQKTVYCCPNCDHIYEISFLTDLLAPHGFTHEGAWLLLRCPNCRVRSRTTTLKKVEEE
jgi:hypothetical protein